MITTSPSAQAPGAPVPELRPRLAEAPPPPPDDTSRRKPRLGSLRSPKKLPYLARIIAGVIAWILLIVGLAGLVLPGLQGVLTLALSATFFSLTSRRVHERLRSAFKPWPKGWRRVVKVRRSLERWFHRFDS